MLLQHQGSSWHNMTLLFYLGLFTRGAVGKAKLQLTIGNYTVSKNHFWTNIKFGKIQIFSGGASGRLEIPKVKRFYSLSFILVWFATSAVCGCICWVRATSSAWVLASLQMDRSSEYDLGLDCGDWATRFTPCANHWCPFLAESTSLGELMWFTQRHNYLNLRIAGVYSSRVSEILQTSLGWPSQPCQHC